jgi:hypothetical protein
MNLTLITGRFGSGKTEVAINYAVALAKGLEGWKTGRLEDGNAASHLPTFQPSASSVLLVDLDIVTPYFRSREMADIMQAHGVQVVAPGAVSRHLDLPAISPQILGAIEQEERPAVVDVGGDPQGARALGQFSPAIRRRPYTMYFVVNPYRPFTDTAARLASSIAEVEGTARLQVTSLVSNPNLIGETTQEVILDGHAHVEDMAGELGLTVAFVCLERRWLAALAPHRFEQPVLPLDRYFRMPWE